ncbi:class GN sortase [Desulfomarina sp.]
MISTNSVGILNYIYKPQGKNNEKCTVTKTAIFFIVSVGCCILGLTLLSLGGWIRVKAVVAGYLLNRSWETSLESGRPVRPWPWADSWPVGRLRTPDGKIDLVILEGDSGEVLAFGPGHVGGSGRVAGNGHCILAGHRDTVFSFLQYLKKNDVLILQGLDGSVKHYSVRSFLIKKANELFFDGEADNRLTLITCYPFSAVSPGGDLRYLVFAEIIPPGSVL